MNSLTSSAMGKKTEIVLDADVIIHFAKGGRLPDLPRVFPQCEFVVLDIVKKEVLQPTLAQLQNQIAYIRNIKEVVFGGSAEQLREYARLVSKEMLGRGECACMVYCRFNNNVVGSSNLKDITKYCNTHNIKYLTTVDFLYYGIKHGIWTEEEATAFIEVVNNKGSKVPVVDFKEYVCHKMD